MTTQIQLMVQFKVHELALFERTAQACSDYVAQHEAGTLTYDWFLNEEKNGGRLLECYRDADALLAHMNGAIFHEIAPQFKRSIQWLSMDAFGPLPKSFFKAFAFMEIRHWPKAHITP